MKALSSIFPDDLRPKAFNSATMDECERMIEFLNSKMQSVLKEWEEVEKEMRALI